MSEKINEFMEEELKKAVGLTANPIAITYSTASGVDESQSNNRQISLISLFESNSITTKTDAFHRLKQDNITKEELDRLDSYNRSFMAAITAYKPNALQTAMLQK